MKAIIFCMIATVTILSRPAAADDSMRHGDHPQTAEIKVTQKGYEPARLALRVGMPIKLTVTRLTDQTCGKEIVLKELGVRRTLTLNKPEVIDITAKQLGSTKKLTFVCGMDMMSGELVLE